MKPILKQIARIYFDRYGSEIHRTAFVFPNRRSGFFFRKYLSECTDSPFFSPEILTISNLFTKLNPAYQADRIKLLFVLYDIYIKKSASNEAFDDFLHWGEMLINDFDEIDKQLIDAKQLFTNVTDLNSIEKDFTFLNPSQTKAILTFWSSFSPEKNDDNQQFFLKVWHILYPIYDEFRKTLHSQNIAYEGMIYRDVIENANSGNLKIPYQKVVFVGFNAISNAEKELFKYLKNNGIAEFYWDYSSEMLKDEDNKASFFMKENLRLFPSDIEIDEDEDENENTRFEVYAMPSKIGQAKQLYPILKELIDNSLLDNETAIQTAIVLPDEQMLMPVLHSIPEEIKSINVTIGYSVSGTPIASLIDFLWSLQKNVRKNEADSSFYYKDVLSILKHNYVSVNCPKETSELIKDIVEKNQVYISAAAFKDSPLLKLVFHTPSSSFEIAEYLTSVLRALQTGLFSQTEENEEDEKIDTKSLEKVFIAHYQDIIKRMYDMMIETGTIVSIDTYFKLLKQMTALIKIPFMGEPLSGLQIMGVLETRALDFKNVIILNVNEGIFPAKTSSNTFIPYQLRRGFGLPTQEHQDSIWAYNFYRLINRAERVIMLYDTRTDGLQSGEVSRFVHQLKYHYKIPVKQKLSVYNIASSRTASLTIEKDREAMNLLGLFEKDKYLSASSINVYLDCPVKFCLSVLKGIKEEDDVSETIENDLFGTLLHRVMEFVYKPLCGKTVTADLLKLFSENDNIRNIINQAFAKDFFHSETVKPLVGQTYLYGETIRKYANKILEYDRSLTPFTYIDSEKLVKTSINIDNGKKVNIKCFIDRIESRDNIVRIIDYKSGRPSSLNFTSMESLFDSTSKDRKKAVMQVFLYAWTCTSIMKGAEIQPVVYYVRDLFAKSDFDPRIRLVVEKEKTVISNFSLYKNEFEDNLRAAINEIFDADKPFVQTSNIKNCEYCYFKNTCGR
jgi:hypothetical protein